MNTLTNLLKDFERAEAGRNCPRHLTEKLRTLRDFVDTTGLRRPKQITVEAVEGYLLVLGDRGLAPKTIANKRADVGRFCKWLWQRRQIKENPVLRIEPPKVPTKEIVYLTDAEFKTAVRLAEKAPAVLIALYTGGRVGEIMALRRSDIRQNGRGPFVVFGSHRPTKTNKVRSVPLHPKLAELFSAITWGDPEAFVFRQVSRRTWDRMLVPFQNRIPTMARRGQGWHTFRRTFASRLIAQGIRIEIVSKLLGHADISTTARHYGHIDTEYGRDAVESL